MRALDRARAGGCRRRAAGLAGALIGVLGLGAAPAGAAAGSDPLAAGGAAGELQLDPLPALHSFRFLASGRTLADDLEYDVDPIDLGRLRGPRLYTNLSNLTSSTETLFGEASDRTLLLGGSGTLPWLPPALRLSAFLQSSSAAAAGELTLDADGDGRPETGTARLEQTQFLDLNGDGTFDLRRETLLAESLESASRRHAWSLAGSWRQGRWSLGARLARDGGSSEAEAASAALDSTGVFVTRAGFRLETTRVEAGSPSFERREENRDQATFRPLAPRRRELGRFGDPLATPLTELQLAAAKQRGRDRWRGDLVLFTTSRTRRIADTFFHETDLAPDPTDAITEAGTLETGYQLREEVHGAGVGLAFAWRRDLGFSRSRAGSGGEREAGAERSAGAPPGAGARHDDTAYLDEQFWELGLDYRQADLDLERLQWRPFALTARQPGSAGRTQVETYDSETRSAAPGDGFLQRLRLHAVLNLNAGRRVRLGLGGSWRYQRREERYDVRASERRVYRFADGDQQPADPDDFTDTFESGFTAAERTEESVAEGVVPVGLEVAITPGRRWKLWAGATARVTRVTSTAERRLESISAPRRWIEWGDGRRESADAGEPVTLDSFRTSRTTVTQDTDFAYGIGYDAAGQLTIDILLFLDGQPDASLLDLAFWQRLRLSLTLRL